MKYVRITKRIFGMLGLRLREGAIMVLLLMLYAGLEGFGIGLLLPVLQFLESGGDRVPTGGVWPFLTDAADFIHVPLNLATLLLLAFLPILARQFVFYLNTWYTASVMARAVERLMSRAFGAVVHADLSFIDRQDQGELISFLTGQSSKCGQALLIYLRMLGALAITSAYVFVLGLISWKLTVLTVAITLLLSWAVRKILVSSRSYGKDATKATNAAYSAIRERLAAVRLLKMRGREDAESEHVRKLAASFRQAFLKIEMAAARMEVIIDPGLMLAVFLVMWVGVELFGMTLSALGLYMFILLRLNGKSKEINLGRQQLSATMPAFDFVESLLDDAETSRTITGGILPFEGLKQRIEYKDVCFTYGDDGEQVLKGVSLTIPRGSLTAMVGRSGAGKSTFVDTIPRLRVPQSGSITFDDAHAEEFELYSLRKHIGFLTQEPILFNDTIYNNLVYGLDERPSDARVAEALDASYCTEFVRDLPKGLETQIGDRGVRFSGGQRQRLALARVLLQDPDILILDEPTSALDSESEQYIQKAFEAVAVNRTVIVIAHRLATVERADQIIVLHEGTVAEVGTHSQLLELPDGHYKRLFGMQIHV